MDKISNERILLLHPAIRLEVQNAINHINKNILGKGVRMRITQGFRTFKEQDELFAQGRTKPGPKVSNAKGGQSLHNYGLAFDICLLYDDGSGLFKEVSWDMKRDGDGDGIADWLEITKYLTSIGFTNGFITNGKKWDFPHFQKDFGLTWQKCFEKYNRKDYISGTIYIKL
ncbi:M15 family metallopeptidase [Flavobacterium qiangtangense]|uniref:M15 family metallopeptidase n=1 Tax=Flavobacterium qiangtangense TaxID=1442595 RepID=A0ABW1PJL1_9FLAO